MFHVEQVREKKKERMQKNINNEVPRGTLTKLKKEKQRIISTQKIR